MPVLSGCSCCWFQAARIMVGSASSPMSRSPMELVLRRARIRHIDCSHSEKCRLVRRLAAGSSVSGKKNRTPRTEGRDFRGESLLGEFSISEIFGAEERRPVAFWAKLRASDEAHLQAKLTAARRRVRSPIVLGMNPVVPEELRVIRSLLRRDWRRAVRARRRIGPFY
jgi:hypothetical protein